MIDTLTTDNPISGAYLDLGSLALYKYDATKEGYLGDVIDSNKYVVQYDEITHKMTVMLPDELACVLVYRYTVDRGSVNTPTLTNSASLKGEFSNQFSFKLKEVDSSASVEKSEVTIFKVDANDYTKRLKGAEFEFSFFDTKESEWTVVGTATTNENGEFILQDQQDVKNLWVGTNFLYRLEEVTAPDGYSKSDKVYYFALMPKETDLDQFYDKIGGKATGVDKDQIQIFGSAGGSLYIPNEFTGIRVRKEWVDQAGDTIAAPGDSSIEVQLKKHLKQPVGWTVTINIKHINGTIWSEEEKKSIYTYGTTTKQILVEKGTNIIITTADNYWLSDITGYTIEIEGYEDPSSTVELVNGQAIFTAKAIKMDCTINIYCGWYSQGTTEKYTSPSSYKYVEVPNDGDLVTSLKASNSWSYSWDGLPKEDGNGNLYYYTIKENTQLNGYTTTYVNNNGIQTGEIVVVNTKDADKEPEYSLPETGGPGKIQYILGGVLLMLASILMYIKKVKSGEGK